MLHSRGLKAIVIANESSYVTQNAGEIRERVQRKVLVEPRIAVVYSKCSSKVLCTSCTRGRMTDPASGVTPVENRRSAG